MEIIYFLIGCCIGYIIFSIFKPIKSGDICFYLGIDNTKIPCQVIKKYPSLKEYRVRLISYPYTSIITTRKNLKKMLF